ncbi:hypothetical protein LOC68_08740 [Blastopirellula sp. JC732]|uniref:Uncharacterized protein n=1 Tax=Blastopirellula sediminis TaxID=2894196 RepID=A0A9X1SF08_9BACT|nr:hypothetical protein [Blastopirellula sediminis]MCC9608743.1 hypothetical protein [Blastopirellula sediminis]MCC9628480.1 hypothetical protein [Blastopirellula sediminis]
MSTLLIFSDVFDLWGGGHWAQIAAAVIATVLFAVISFIVTQWADRKRLTDSIVHFSERGTPTKVEASLEDVFHDARLFNYREVSIGQLSREQHGGVDVDVYELTYETHGVPKFEFSNRDPDGPSRPPDNRKISQTVVSIPIGPHDDLRFFVMHADAWPGSRFGHSQPIGSATSATPEEQELLNWFNQNFAVTPLHPANHRQFERMLDSPTLQWLKEHHRVEFEFADSHLLVWIPAVVFFFEDRATLIHDAIALRDKLLAHKSTESPAICLPYSPGVNPQIVLGYLALSGLAACAIAVPFLGFCFLIATLSGFLEQAPTPTKIGIAIATLIVWIGLSLFLLKSPLHRSQRQSEIDLHDPAAVGGSAPAQEMSAAAEEAARRRMRKL